MIALFKVALPAVEVFLGVFLWPQKIPSKDVNFCAGAVFVSGGLP